MPNSSTDSILLSDKEGSNPKPLPSKLGGLYPTVAISDLFNTLCHCFAAFYAYQLDNGFENAALGYITVAVASAVGTIRFAFNENLSQANGDLADIAAYVGLPLVGLAFLPTDWQDQYSVPTLLIVLILWEGITRSLSKSLRELSKIVTNTAFFVGPVASKAIGSEDWVTLGGVVLFAFAGIAIGQDRDRFLFGVRRENWFHYAIGIAAIIISLGLKNT